MMVLFSHLSDCTTCQGPLAVFRALRAFVSAHSFLLSQPIHLPLHLHLSPSPPPSPSYPHAASPSTVFITLVKNNYYYMTGTTRCFPCASDICQCTFLPAFPTHSPSPSPFPSTFPFIFPFLSPCRLPFHRFHHAGKEYILFI